MSQRLLKDLKELVEANIIPAETARQIEVYYKHKETPSSNRFTTALGILGALLFGIGLILIVAHNWESLGRSFKTFFAFIPLAIAQALCLYTLVRKKNNTWKEGSASFLLLTIASSIALIGQIYQINGNLDSFLFTWILLSLPLVYIMNSSVVSLMIIGLVTWYACLKGYDGAFSSHALNIPYLYPVVILLLIPHYRNINRLPYNNAFYLHNWFFAVSLGITLGIFIEKDDALFEWIFIGYTCLSGIYILAGKVFPMKNERWLANPFMIIGILGILVTFLSWSFSWLWEELDSNSVSNNSLSGVHFSITGILLFAIWAVVYIWKHYKLKFAEWDLPAFSPFIFVAGTLLFRNNFMPGLLLFNAWILLLSVFYIRKGALMDHLGILNFGLLIFASLAIFRFFDSDIPFIWRGLIFLSAGAGFFIANYLILKKRKSIAKNPNA